MRTISLVLLVLFYPLTASGVEPQEVLQDPRLEQRARAISSGLRCLVCQNQSIDESDAPLAKDLRLLVRDQLKQGATDEFIRQFVVARYGEFVLLKPSFSYKTWILWLGPLLLMLGGLFFIVRNNRPLKPEEPLHDKERESLKNILSHNHNVK